jgi:dolichol-phosphate mannosyltransferase
MSRAASAADLPVIAADHPKSSSRAARKAASLRVLLILVGITFLLRFLALRVVPLMPEEAYYWMYSQHPSLSYFDHPPMVAWVISAGTRIFDDTQFGVRICNNLIATASIGLMYWYARIWTGRRIAFASALSLAILPFYFLIGFIAMMDSQLVFFWLLCLTGASLALRRDLWWGWYMAGLGFGGAMLSKYTGVFAAPGVLLAIILYPPWRRHLRSPHAYLGALLGACLFLPVIYWNAQHGWASFRFQFLDRSEMHPLWSWRSPLSALNFFGLQLAVVTPVFAIAAASFFTGPARLRRALHRPMLVFVFCAALPMLAAMAWKSVTYDVHIDWTAPAYLSLFPLVCGRSMSFLRWSLARRFRLWEASIVFSLVACAAANLVMMLFLLLITPRIGMPLVFGPWQQLDRVVQRYESQLELATHRQALVVGRGKYRLASELAFYRAQLEKPVLSSANTTSQWFIDDTEGLGYSYWLNRQDWKGRDCIYVTDRDDIKSVVIPRFRHVQLVDDPVLHTLPGGVVYRLAICEGFKG